MTFNSHEITSALFKQLRLTRHILSPDTISRTNRAPALDQPNIDNDYCNNKKQNKNDNY